MMNQESFAAVAAAHFKRDFCRPLYDTYGFARIPDTIEALFTGDYTRALPEKATGGAKVDDVFVFLIDAFGWRFFEKYVSDYPFLQRFAKDGIVSKITAQFPSTTAAHVTCMHTGKNVGETGVYEWFYYEPKVDRVIAPLLFSFAGDAKPDALAKTGISPQDIFPKKTFYQRLKQKGIDSYVFSYRDIIDSAYSSVLHQGAQSIFFHELDDALQQLVSHAQRPREKPTYFYFYFGDIDAAGHRYGIHSQHFEQAIEHCFQALETLFWQQIGKCKRKTACIVIADHGMTQVHPAETFYLNEKMPQLLESFKRNRQGELIAPAGSCRDFFLHIQEDRLCDVEAKLQEQLQEIAWVVSTKKLLEQGFFGANSPSPELLSRVGNLVILPHGEQAVWWLEKGKFDQHFLGSHGGLTKQEMETIFLFQTI